MLRGEGPHWTNDASPPRKALASKAWRPWPTPGRKSEELAPIRQGPDEPHQDFVSRLLQAVSRSVPDGEAGMLPVTHGRLRRMQIQHVSLLLDLGKRRVRYRTMDVLCADIGPS